MRRVLLVLAALAALFAIAWFEPTGIARGFLRREPFFDGRPASAWASRLRDVSEQQIVESRRKLKAGGAAAVPVLASIVETRSTNWGTATVRVTAADLLGELGPAAADAIPALINALSDTDATVRSRAAEALGAVGPGNPQVVGALTAQLKTADARSAARGLARCGAAALTATDALIALLDNADPDIRWNAERTLGKIRATAAIPRLVSLLNDPDDQVREHAAEALGDIGPEAASTVPALIASLKDKYVKVRRDAARSLGQIGSGAQAAIPALQALVKDDSEEIVRQAAAAAIQRIAPSGPTSP